MSLRQAHPLCFTVRSAVKQGRCPGSVVVVSFHVMLEVASAVLLLSVSSCYFVVRRLRQNLYEITTGDNDIPTLRQARPDTEKLDGTVVICGG